MADLDYQYIASLAADAKMGNHDAFAELYAATCQQQYRFAYSYLQDEFLAQDAVRDTYVQVLKGISALKDTELFISWLNQLTFRICFHLRKKIEEKDGTIICDYDGSADCPPDDQEPEEYAVQVNDHRFIIRQILNLPFTESQIIILHYYNHLEICQIAGLMEMSRRSVRKYLTSGRKKLELLFND